MNRQEMIDRILNDDIDTIKQGIYQNDYTYLIALVLEGIKGLNQYSDKELQHEYECRFN